MKNPLITEVQQNDLGIGPYTETICNQLIRTNGHLSKSDLSKVLKTVRVKFPSAAEQVVRQVVYSRVTE